MKKHLLILAALILAVPGAEAKKKKKEMTVLTGIVQKCYDGDTCRVLVQNKIAKIRFAGIDTPELRQQHGKEAQQFTEGQLKGKTVDLKCDGASWDRITCTVYLEGRNFNQVIVQKGWAYDSTQFSKGAYKQDELTAKAQRLGVWASQNLQSPYCFRHKANKKCRVSALYMP